MPYLGGAAIHNDPPLYVQLKFQIGSYCKLLIYIALSNIFRPPTAGKLQRNAH
jgi:hypothetical protein